MNYILPSPSILAWLAILAGGWLGWQLLRQNGRLLLRLEELEKRLDTLGFGEDERPAGLPLGSDAPAFELPDLAGERKSLAQFWGQPLLLIFFNPACGLCGEMAPKLAALTRSVDSLPHAIGEGRGPVLLVITTGDPEPNRQIFTEHKVHCPVLLQKDGEAAKAYHANGTPTGYLIDAEGKIASELTFGAEALLALASHQPSTLNSGPSPSGNGNGREHRFGNRSLARSKIKRDGLEIGTMAPDFRLPRVDGRGDLALADLRGCCVLLVFSSPGCGPCLELAPRLETFHRAQPELELVMISKGEPKENRAKVRAFGLTFPIVLQQQWEISRRYAMFATPIAYLIDEQGIIARDVAVGEESIIDLMASAAQLASAGHRQRRALGSGI